MHVRRRFLRPQDGVASRRHAVEKPTRHVIQPLPVDLEGRPWRRTKSSPPDNLLVPTDPKKLDYGRNPYVGYDLSAAPFLYRGDLPKDIEPMARVVVVRPILGKPKAVTLEL